MFVRREIAATRLLGYMATEGLYHLRNKDQLLVPKLNIKRLERGLSSNLDPYSETVYLTITDK